MQNQNEFKLYRIISAIIMQNEKILLVLNKDEYSNNLWGLPGGVIEKDENLLESLKREIWEEVGLTFTDVKIAYVHESFIPQYSAHSLVTTFEVNIIGNKPKIQDPDGEIIDYKWVDVNEIENFIKNSAVLLPLKNWLKNRNSCEYFFNENLVWN
ncbi:NUDIX domain-containing protein [Sutcliffiella horikoshii]|uniref:NUDIX domain-containing protein n=1 Tax=Sutcliffiella horikoshii TaxID=79883 RepID=UPI003CEDC3E9